MDISAYVDVSRREIALREVSAFSVGDVGTLRLTGLLSADVSRLRLHVYRKDMRTEVAEFSGFSVTEGHPLVREVEFDFTGEAFRGWVDADGPGETSAYIVLEDGSTTWCACFVPFVLRPVSPSQGD